MSAHAPFRTVHAAKSQRGIALITGLLLLLVLTLIAVSMFRGYGVEEQIAGNTREKQRALNAAVSAQQYAEWWLVNGTVPPSADCTALVNSDTGQVCLNQPTVDFSTVPWQINNATVGVNYLPFQQSGLTITGQNGQPNQGSYYGTPAFYITDLGSSLDPLTGNSGELYQIDAYSYGGTQNTVAEVESTYLVTDQYGMRQLDIQK